MPDSAGPHRPVSSSATFFVKRLIPLVVLWISGPASLAFIGLALDESHMDAAVVVFPAIFVIGLMLLGRTYDLADEVLDEGELLRISKGKDTVFVPLLAISDITEPTEVIKRVTLDLNDPALFGGRVAFMLRKEEALHQPPYVEELKQRVRGLKDRQKGSG